MRYRDMRTKSTPPMSSRLTLALYSYNGPRALLYCMLSKVNLILQIVLLLGLKTIESSPLRKS